MAEKHQRFGHEYNHCKGIDCERKDDCAFYLAYQEALDQGLQNIKIVERCNDDRIYVKVTIEKLTDKS